MYSVLVKSKNGFHFYDIYDSFDDAIDVAVSNRNYFDEHRPGELEVCVITEICDNDLVEPFVYYV